MDTRRGRQPKVLHRQPPGSTPHLVAAGITTHRIAVKGKSSLLKLSPSSSKESISLLANEKSALLSAGRHVKVPSILAYGKKKVGRSHQSYLLLEHLRGAPFVPGRDYRSAVDYLGILHSRSAGMPHSLKEAPDAAAYLIEQASLHAALLKKSKTPAPSIRKEAFSLLAEAKWIAKTRRKASYLSLNNAHILPNNFTKTQQGLSLSDWSHAAYSSPALDICLFLSPFSLSWRSAAAFGDEKRNEFLQRYLAHFPEAAQQEITEQCSRASLPASAYLFLLGLTSSSPQRHFSNLFFVKKAAAEARRPFNA